MDNGNDDKRFASWLRRNTDEVPEARTDEKTQIWNAIERSEREAGSAIGSRSRKPSSNERRWSISDWMIPQWMRLTGAAVLILSIIIGIQTQRDASPGQTFVVAVQTADVEAQGDFDEIIEDSLDLGFLDNGEIIEVAALNGLGVQ